MCRPLIDSPEIESQSGSIYVEIWTFPSYREDNDPCHYNVVNGILDSIANIKITDFYYTVHKVILDPIRLLDHATHPFSHKINYYSLMKKFVGKLLLIQKRRFLICPNSVLVVLL